jgi:demethoxyubiquinone hydroxylase (CLK1/Coq7/Cat5 family)
MTTATHSIHAQLVGAQAETLATPRRRYSVAARLLFSGMDLLYGRKAGLPKFVVLELVARVPYQTWEHAAYLAITRHAGETRLARRIYDRVCRVREQQDNEQWHLFILEDILEEDGVRLNWFRYRLVPQLIALVYYVVALAMYLISPAWSHRLNADFEDHAEHEYMAYVAAHPELDAACCTCSVADDYGHFSSRGDVIRRIALDERAHKQESLDQLETLSTSRARIVLVGAFGVLAVVGAVIGFV